MKTTLLQIKKHSVRLLTSLGALLGISACTHFDRSQIETVYGPPPPEDSIEVTESPNGDSIEVSETSGTINTTQTQPQL